MRVIENDIYVLMNKISKKKKLDEKQIRKKKTQTNFWKTIFKQKR